MALEKPADPAPTPAGALADFGGVYAVNGLVGFIFAASGPVAIILAVGTRGGLSASDLASWIFGAFFVNGLISIIPLYGFIDALFIFGESRECLHDKIAGTIVLKA